MSGEFKSALELIGAAGRKAALIVGDYDAAGGTGRENTVKEIDRAVAELLSAGIRSFFFIRWGRFEELFAERLSRYRPTHKIQAILIGNSFTCKLANPWNLDKILWADELGIDLMEVVDALISYCGTLAYYGDTSPEIKAMISRAALEDKKIIPVSKKQKKYNLGS